jgi:hypothetical protein
MRTSKTQRRARELFFVLFTLEDEGLKSNRIKRRAYLEEEEEEEEEKNQEHARLKMTFLSSSRD